MKKLLNYNTLLISLALLMMVSCNKILVEKPKSKIDPGEFFKTVDQCTQATNGVYGHLPPIFAQVGFWASTMAGTDLMMYHGGGLSIKAIQEYNFSSSTEDNSAAVWTSCYAGVKDANFAIARITASPIDDSSKSRLLGECKFLRAMFYYMLSNNFGAVPLWTEEVDVDKVGQLPRTPLKDVRAQMITDLKDAESGLPLNYNAANVGRVTKGAAEALLAKVYLFNKDWKNAFDNAQAVISQAQYSLIDYAALFDPNQQNKNNKESVFEIQYNRDASTNQNFQNNTFYNYFLPVADASGGTYAGVNFGTTILQSYAAYYPSDYLYRLYDTADKRKDVVLSWGYNGQKFKKLPVANRPWFGPKFWDLTGNKTASAMDFYFLRYADVIMVAAEAANEQGNTATAISLLNQIEKRAGLPDIDGTLNQQQLRNFIMDERAREFAGEFQRKWDLARWGVLVQAVQRTKPENTLGAENVKAFNALYPVPYNEIIKNRNLDQNEGYK